MENMDFFPILWKQNPTRAMAATMHRIPVPMRRKTRLAFQKSDGRSASVETYEAHELGLMSIPVKIFLHLL